VTFRIYARFAEADQERPIPITMSVRFPPDGPDGEALRDFNDFGTPVAVDESHGAEIEWSVDLPGGLGGAFQSGRLSLGPARAGDAEPYRLRLQILDAHDQEISTCGVQMEPVTRGLSGFGVRAIGAEQNGVFSIEIRTDFVAQRIDLRLTSCDLTGKHPTDVLPGLRVAAAFRPPNKMRFAPPYGPVTHPGDGIPAAIDLGLGDVLRVVEALAIIQDHTAEQIVIPDLATVTASAADELIRLDDAHLNLPTPAH